MSKPTRDISDVLRDAVEDVSTPAVPDAVWNRIAAEVPHQRRSRTRRNRSAVVAGWVAAACLAAFGMFVVSQDGPTQVSSELRFSSLSLDLDDAPSSPAVRVDASWYDGLTLKDGGQPNAVLRSCSPC